jgi:hypothetical protein
VYARKVNNITELKHRIEETLASITQDMLLNVWNEISYRLDVLMGLTWKFTEFRFTEVLTELR